MEEPIPEASIPAQTAVSPPVPSDLKVTLDISPAIEPERAAMLLAWTSTREQEEIIKQVLSRIPGLRFAVTEIGGMNEDLRTRILPQVVGACINRHVIERRPSHIHALLHALIEAERGLMSDAPISGSMSMKIAVAVRGAWLAVAIFGESAFHVITNHKRAGLGVMHFSNNRGN